METELDAPLVWPHQCAGVGNTNMKVLAYLPNDPSNTPTEDTTTLSQLHVSTDLSVQFKQSDVIIERL